MKRATLFPMQYENRELLIYPQLVRGYKICSAVTVTEYNDSLEIISERDQNIFITANFKDAISDCDAVIFLRGLESKQPALYIEKLQETVDRSKDIVIDSCLYNTFKEILEDYPQMHIIDLSRVNEKEAIADYQVNEDRKLRYLNIPIISVMGMGDYCNKFSCELALRDYFCGKGYNVLQIGSKMTSEIFGFYNIPEFLYSKEFTLEDKIILFNYYITFLVKKQKPDLIIIGIPGGILPANSKILNSFGELPFIMTNALKIDVGILSIYGNTLSEELISEYKKCCKYRFNTNIMHTLVSNTYFEFDTDRENRYLKYYHLNETKDIPQELHDKESIFSIGNTKNVFDSIYEALSETLEIL